MKEWPASIPDLDELYTLKSYEQLENIINAWLAGDDEDNTTENTTDTETNTVTRGGSKNTTETSKTGGSKKTFDKIDDAFADLGGDLPF